MSSGGDDGRSPEPTRSKRDLPSALLDLVEEVVDRSGLPEATARRARADLEEHFREGLARGRSVAELARRFGDPVAAARLLARHPAPDPWTGRGSPRGFLRSVVDDLRHGLRSLAKSPSVSVTVALVLALGLGASTVAFTVLNELLLRPVPVVEPESLVDVWADVPGDNSFTGFAYRDFVSYRDGNRVLEALAAFIGRRLELGDGPIPRQVTGQFVSPEYFPMLGLRASVGSMSLLQSTRFGEELVAVLSHAFWSDAYGADPTVVGSTIRVDDRAVTVVGVGPPGFTGHFIGFPVDLWLPLAAADPLVDGFAPDDRTRKDLEMIGRLRPDVSLVGARSALNAIAERIEREYPDVNRGHRVGVTRTTGLDHSLHAAVRTFVAILTVVSVLVLLIACLNVGGVLLVRAMARERELAVRVALGAGRLRLLRHLVTESALLVLIATVLGLAVAVRSNGILADLLRSMSAGVGLDLVVDWRVLGMTALAAAAAALLATVAPALHVFRRSPAGMLGARRGDAPGSARLRSTLVVGQVAISVLLVIATGLFVRALFAASASHPGFDAESIATFAFDPGDEEGERARAERSRDVSRAVSALASIDAVAAASAPPIGVGRTPLPVVVPGVLPPPDSDHHVVDVRHVGPGYLEVLGVPLLAGRDIGEADRSGPAVAVVSAAFQRRFGAAGSLIGSTIQVDGREARVVGVAADARYVVQDDTPDPLVYLSSGPEEPLTFLTLRASDPSALAGDVHSIVTEVVPGHRRTELRTGRAVLDAALLPQRIGVAIVGSMGLAALFLAAVGLYGLIRFTVARDRHELGVRLALGGGRRELLLVVLRKGVRLVVIGTTLGVGGALVLAPGLSGFLSGVSPADPLTYGLVVVCFGIVALAASWLPARRAMSVDAMEALRSE